MCYKICLQPEKFHHIKQTGVPQIAISGMSCSDLQKQLRDTFEKKLSCTEPRVTANERWEHLSTTIQWTAMSTFEKKAAKTSDWFEAKSNEMSPVIRAKRLPLLIINVSQMRGTFRSSICTNEYWMQLSKELQITARTGNIRGMHDGIEEALGPSQSKTAPLKAAS